MARVPRQAQAPRPASDVLRDLTAARLPVPVERLAHRVLRRLIWAESRAHQCAPHRVVFHQLGRPAALAMLVGVAAGIAALRPARIVASPLLLGRRFQDHDGRWRWAVAPAVRHLTTRWPHHLSRRRRRRRHDGPKSRRQVVGWPTRVSRDPVEYTTPMGAAIITALATPSHPIKASFTFQVSGFKLPVARPGFQLETCHLRLETRHSKLATRHCGILLDTGNDVQ